MDWLWGSWSTPAAPLTKRTSESITEFDYGKTGSLVLNFEDLRAINAVTKLEKAKKKLEEQRARHEDEIQLLQDRKQGLMLALNRKLEESMDETFYQGIVQNLYLQDGLEMAYPGDGTEEAKIIMETHKSEIQDKLRAMCHSQASDDMMEIYGTSARIKERMGEREAKYLSALVQADVRKSQCRELKEEYLKIQKRLLSIYHQAAKVHVEKKLAGLGKTAGSPTSSEISAEPPVFDATKAIQLKDVGLEEGVGPDTEPEAEVKVKPSNNAISQKKNGAIDVPQSPVSTGSKSSNSRSSHSKSSNSKSSHSRSGLTAALAARARTAPSSSESARSSKSAKSTKSSGRAISAAAVRERRGKVGAAGVARGAGASTTSRVVSASGRTGVASTAARTASGGRTGAASTAARTTTAGRTGAASTPAKTASVGGRTGAARTGATSRLGTAGRTTTAGRTGATAATKARVGAPSGATAGRGTSAAARNVSAAGVAARREARAKASPSGAAGASTPGTPTRPAGKTASGRTGTASGRTRIARPAARTAAGGTK